MSVGRRSESAMRRCIRHVPFRFVGANKTDVPLDATQRDNLYRRWGNFPVMAKGVFPVPVACRYLTHTHKDPCILRIRAGEGEFRLKINQILARSCFG